MKKILLVILLTISANLNAQDVAFSNPFVATAYVNPSLIRILPYRITVKSSYRLQSPKINGGHNAYYTECSFQLKSAASRFNLFGLYETNDVLTKQVYYFNYIYAWRITRKMRISPNIGIGFGKWSVDWQKLTFGDMIDPYSYPGYIYATGDVPRGGNVNYIDFRTGFSFQWDALVIGTTVAHLTQPDVSVIKGKSPLPMLFSSQLAYSWRLAKNRHSGKGVLFTPFFTYTQQSRSVLFNYGVMTKFRQYWTIGISPQHSNGLSFIFRADAGNFNIGFVYTRNTSGLNQITGGSYEFSFRLNFLKRPLKGSGLPDYGWFN